MITLTVVRHKKTISQNFDSVLKAYRYYLLHYSTFSDWFYYFKTAHLPLFVIKDEECIEAIFFNVLKDACICERN